MTESTASRSWFRRLAFRLSVRGLILLVMTTGGAMGWIVHRAKIQREAVRKIEAAGGIVGYDWIVIGGNLEVASGRPTLWKSWIDAIGVDYLGNVTRVDFFPGSRSKLTDDVLASVGRLPYLESLMLQVSSRRAVTDAGLARLRGLARLNRLSIIIHGGPGVDLSIVDGMGRLEHLQLAFSTVTDTDLAHVAHLTRLKSLEICINSAAEDAKTRSISDDGLAALEPLKDLENLQLDGTRVTTAGLVHLGGMRRLKSLRLAYTRVTSLEPLRQLDGLEGLSLDHSQLTDDGAAPIADFRRLDYLNLQGTPIGDDALARVSALPVLKTLVVSQSRVTTEGRNRIARPGLTIVP